jgi:hypothetical protein
MKRQYQDWLAQARHQVHPGIAGVVVPRRLRNQAGERWEEIQHHAIGEREQPGAVTFSQDRIDQTGPSAVYEQRVETGRALRCHARRSIHAPLR